MLKLHLGLGNHTSLSLGLWQGLILLVCLGHGCCTLVLLVWNSHSIFKNMESKEGGREAGGAPIVTVMSRQYFSFRNHNFFEARPFTDMHQI